MVWCARTPMHIFVWFCTPRSLMSHCGSVQTALIIAPWSPVVGGDGERSLRLAPACKREKRFSSWENRGKEQLKSLHQSQFFAPTPCSSKELEPYAGVQGNDSLMSQRVGNDIHTAALHQGDNCPPLFQLQTIWWRGAYQLGNALLPWLHPEEDWGRSERLGCWSPLLAGTYFIWMRLR